METRSITVKEIQYNRKFTTNSGFTIHYFKLTDVNDEIYEFSTNVENQKKFVGGQTYEVIVEHKQNKGGDYMFIDLSQSEKDSRKPQTGNKYTGNKRPYYRTRAELMSIISQSSYEAATLLCINYALDKIVSMHEITSIAKVLSTFVVEASQLDSDACKREDPVALKAANDKSIVMQKAIKIAIETAKLPKLKLKDENDDLKGTKRIIAIAEELFEEINSIADGL